MQRSPGQYFDSNETKKPNKIIKMVYYFQDEPTTEDLENLQVKNPDFEFQIVQEKKERPKIVGYSIHLPKKKLFN